MNTIQIFSNPAFGEVRIQIGASNEPLFCASDVCSALGYSNGRDAVAKHVDDPDVAKRDAWVETGKKTDGTPALRQTEMTFVNESGLYSLIFGSKLESAKAFKRWVTSEVLPSIRKQGGYMAAKADESAEEVMARALLIAQQTLQRRNERIKALESENRKQTQLLVAQSEQIKDLNETNAEMRVKVSYYDQILNSKSTVTTTQIAQDYGMSAKKFNIMLRNLKIQRKVGGQWILYSPYNTMGYVHSETFVPDGSVSGKVVMISRWTQKGRLFLYEILKKNDVYPLIER